MSPKGTGTLPRPAVRGARTKAILRPAGLASVGLGVLLVVLSSVTGTARASTVDGSAVITDPTTNTAITQPGQSGGEQFTLVLPPQAACDGDTATGGYHIYSYMIAAPATDTPANVTSAVLGLNPATGVATTYFPLTDNGGNFYGPANTAIGTGQITTVPLNLDFQPLNTALAGSGLATLPGTTKEIGILCATQNNVVTDFWNQEVTFTASGTDASGFTWSPGTSGSTVPTTTTSSTVASSTTSTTTGDTSSTDSTSTSVDQSTTSTTASGTDTGTTSSTVVDTGGSGGQSSGSTGDPSSSSGSSGQLAATGSSLKPELNAGVLLIAAGALMLVGIPRRRLAQVDDGRQRR